MRKIVPWTIFLATVTLAIAETVKLLFSFSFFLSMACVHAYVTNTFAYPYEFIHEWLIEHIGHQTGPNLYGMTMNTNGKFTWINLLRYDEIHLIHSNDFVFYLLVAGFFLHLSWKRYGIFLFFLPSELVLHRYCGYSAADRSDEIKGIDFNFTQIQKRHRI